MSVSLVISTYNDTISLRRCLLGVLVQTRQPDQIIVSDDGSKRETLEVLQSPDFASLPIEHVWQADAGFRRPRALNLSLNHCQGDYVVFCDGDCVPRADFVEAHLRHARPRTFVSGSIVDIPREVHPRFTEDQILDNTVFSSTFLESLWPGASRYRRRLAPGRWETLLNTLTYRYCTLRGSNFSAWRDDILGVNGFDELFGYGSDDREFGVRLRNSGVSSKWVKFSLIQLHLGHPRGWVDPARAARQRWKFRMLFLTGTTRVEPGIDTAVARALREDSVPYRHAVVHRGDAPVAVPMTRPDRRVPAPARRAA